MALAINILALLIVVGLCWAAMMWLSGRFHGHTHPTGAEPGDFLRDDAGATPRHGDEPCVACDGVGAQSTRGRIAPCPECYGTGVLG